MKFIKDEKIHLYLINPDLLTKEEIDIIESNKNESEDFQDYLNELQSFYKDESIPVKISDEEYEKQILPVIQSYKNLSSNVFIEEQSANIFEMYPYSFANESKFLKVAEQEQEIAKGIKRIGTLSSADNLILMRILKNNSTGQFSMHLISEDMSKVENAVVSIKELDKDFAADEKGVVKINEDIAFQKYKVNVHSPIAKFVVENISDTIINSKIPALPVLPPGRKNFDVDLEIKNFNCRLIFNSGKSSSIKVFLIFEDKNFIEIKPNENLEFTLPKNLSFPFTIILVEE